MFDDLLGLEEGWEVTGIETDLVKGEVDIRVECRLKEFLDVGTGQWCKVYDHAPMRRWRHLDTLQYKTYLSCALPRITLPTGQVRTVDPPWASSHERHTHLFERLAIDLLQATGNQTRSAALLRCGFNVVNRIMHLSVERGMERRSATKGPIAHLSIDEKSFRKGHTYVSVLSDPIAGCVLDVQEDRTKEACAALLNRALDPEQQKQVRTITMDMWKAYLTTAKELLCQARVIHDRFHLVKHLNTAIDQVRRREVKTHDLLKKSRYALLKNPENLTEKQRIRFDAIKAANYEVARAWQARENFKDLFPSSPSEAFHAFMKWVSDSTNRRIKELTKVVVMFQDHIKGVLHAIASPFSNAMAERLNGKIQLLKSVGRGYRTFANFRSAILFFNGGLNLYP